MIETYETVLANGKIVDGCGNPWYWGDLAIENDQIAAIAPAGSLRGKQTIQVEGRYVTPGIIDIHTHSDLAILANSQADSVVRQGVTTEVIGNCGMAPAPVDDAHLEEMRSYWGNPAYSTAIGWQWRSFGDYLSQIETRGTAINIAALAGHGAIRMAVLGFAERAPEPAELDRMKSLAAEAMQAGAFGMSTGLVYPPGCFASTDEIVALCRVVSSYGGIYTSHIRGERETILEAVAEAIEIGRRANLPVQISHNAPKFGAPCDARSNLSLVEAARAKGQDVTVDNDVHTDLGPALAHSLPQEIQHETIATIQAWLADPARRKAIKEEIKNDQRPAFGPAGLLRHEQWSRITIYHAANAREATGKSIETLAKERSQDPFDVYFDLIVENGQEVYAIFDYIDEQNIRILLQHPAVMICSDGSVAIPEDLSGGVSSYEPCSYGEFPGVLERYVREQRILTLEEAIRKMTSFPAQRLGLLDRGVLRPGARADIAVIDLERVRDRATNLYPHAYPFENYPHQYPEGIDYVFVNGSLVIEGERHTGSLPGKVLRHRIGN